MKFSFKLISTLILVCLAILFFVSCSNKQELKKIRFNQVTQSIFYAPQYVAIEKGFFKEEGLDIDLTTGWGSDKTMNALLSNNADIGLLGPETAIYVFNEKKEDNVMIFAQLTQRAGNFLVSREKFDKFDWDNIKGKTIIGGRKGGLPQMTLEYILKKKNIKPFEDVKIITNIDFAATGAAFIGGVGDFSVEFEPAATKLENAGKGYVVASLGVSSGKIPYTNYAAKKSFIDKNPEIIQKFTNAIYKAQVWVKNHSEKEIAEAIKPQFKDMDMDSLVKIINRYKTQDTWRNVPLFDEASLALLEDVLDEAGELKAYVDYNDIVVTDFALKAQK